jgi:hypothetical protein
MHSTKGRNPYLEERMPKTSTRHRAKRKLSSAKGNIDQCGMHINEVSNIYLEHHPEISEQLDMVLTILSEVDSMIEHLASSI